MSKILAICSRRKLNCLSRYVQVGAYGLLNISGAIALLWFMSSPSILQAQQPEQSCRERLPLVTWLGEGEGDYTLEEEYDLFIVKRLDPFRFDIEPGVTSAESQTVYSASDNERVWACAGDCQIPSTYHAAVNIGEYDIGWQIDLIVIDDDGPEQNNDTRYNWWADNDPRHQYSMIHDQQMVEYLSLQVPHKANWFFYAKDSIGVVAQCIEPSPPTPTSTPTDTPTSTPTDTPTLAPTDMPTSTPTDMPTAMPTDTPTAMPTDTPTAMPTDTPTATPTDAPTSTPTDASTPTSTPFLTDTPTATPTPTDTPSMPTSEPTRTNTPTAVPTIPMNTPTATPTDFPLVIIRTSMPTPTQPGIVSVPLALSVYQFLVFADGQIVRLQWETGSEYDTFGYHILRSSDDQRATAVQVTEQIIMATESSGAGATYRFVDTSTMVNTRYSYWLQEVTIDGSTVDHGPVKLEQVNILYLPISAVSD